MHLPTQLLRVGGEDYQDLQTCPVLLRAIEWLVFAPRGVPLGVVERLDSVERGVPLRAAEWLTFFSAKNEWTLKMTYKC